MKRMLLNASLLLMLVVGFGLLNAQTTNVVQGTVKDNKGEPVIGAAVAAKGTTIGTLTDAEGKFSIAVPSGTQSLVVKYIGYKSAEVAIAGGNFNVVLKEDALGLEEVVVTAQSVKREKRSLGYSTTTVNTGDLNNASPSSALEALQGKVAGAQITSASGAPGGSTRIVLRGGSSLTGDNNALIVIDGIPVDNSNFGFGDVLNNQYDPGSRANDINPEDIESVTVLKGAAAVALYGQRGANGAILYTTKNGKDVVKSGRKFKVSVSENITAESPLKLPTNQNQFGQGSQDNYGNNYFDTHQNWSWGPQFNGQPMYWGTPITLPNGTQQIRVKPYSAEPDNIKDFFNTGATYNTNVSIAGGDKGTTFYTAFNNVKYNGIVPTTGWERNSLRFNVSHDFGDALTVSGNFNYTNTNSTLAIGGQQNQSVWFMLLNTPRDIPIKEIADMNNPYNQPSQFYDPFYPNPYWALQNQKTTDKVDRFVSNVNSEWKPTKWLSFIGRFGADIYTDTREQQFTKYSFTPIYFYNGQTAAYQEFPSPNPTQYPGRFDQDRFTLNNYTGDIMARFSKEFKHDVSFNAMLGFNIYSNTLKNTFGETAGLMESNVFTFSNSAARPLLINQTFQNRLLGAYADINFGYKNFFFLELTGRNDWSSTLPINNRSYFYPGASTSLVFTDIGQKKINPMILSYGKLRASIAQIGRDAPPYSLTNYFVPGDISDNFLNTDIRTPYVSPASSNVPGYQVGGSIQNPNLKPEISTTWEAGIELSFLKDRLSVDFTYYWKLSKNEILTVPLGPSTGYNSEVVNAGVFRNQGVELAVRGVPISTKYGLKWEIFGTFTKNVSKVLEVANNADQIVLGGSSGSNGVAVVVQKGEPYGTFYGSGVQMENGHVVVDPNSGLPLQATKPSVLGNFSPKWLGSIGTSLSYKGFKFTILFDGRDGGQFYSNTASVQQFLGSDIATAYNNRDPFVVPNSVYLGPDNQYHPSTVKVGAFNYWYQASLIPSYQIIAADFVKLREISITYSLPKKVLAKTRYLTGVSVKVFGSNLWLWTPKSNTFADPETNASGATNVQGFEFLNLPSLRNYGGGFTFDF